MEWDLGGKMKQLVCKGGGGSAGSGGGGRGREERNRCHED
jgi:hypothetical protein